MRTNFERNRRSGRKSINSNSNRSKNKDEHHPVRKCFINIFEVLDDDERQRFVERAKARVERLTGSLAGMERLEHYGKSYVLKSAYDESDFVSILDVLEHDEMRALMEKSSNRKQILRERMRLRDEAVVKSVGFIGVMDVLNESERAKFNSRSERIRRKCIALMKREAEKTRAQQRYSKVSYSGGRPAQNGIQMPARQQKAVFDVTHQNPGEKQLKSVTNESYDHVTDESLMVLAKIECRLMDYLERAPAVPTKKSQAQVDLEIVKNFYENPTPEAFAGLWKRYRWGVQSHISKFVGDWSNSDDLVQETFQKAWEKRFMFDPLKASFSTWLYTIARNLTFTYLKKEGQAKVIDVDVNDVYTSALHPNGENAATVDETYYIVNSPDDVESNTFDEVTHKMYTESVARVKDMDPMFQKVLIMKNLRGMTLREISAALNISESKLKNMYYKCREMLCEKIKDECSELYNIYVDAAHDHADDENQYIYG